MSNQQRKDRALEALTKYRGRITIRRENRELRGVVCKNRECAWNDLRKEAPTDTMLVLLKDSKANVVRLG
jgi:hypothetical protein